MGRDGVAAKGVISTIEKRDERENIKSPRRPFMSSMQPLHIPAKVPENEEVQVITTSVYSEDNDNASLDTVMENSDEMDFQFDADENGTWVTANPVASVSRSSLATATTGASTLIDDSNRFSQYSHAPSLTVDTSVASSATSMMSSSASTCSTDIYGWEEELGRMSSTDGRNPWVTDTARRLPSGGRTYGPFPRRHEVYKRADGKRKSLLYRVLNLSGRRSGNTEEVSGPPPSGAITNTTT